MSLNATKCGILIFNKLGTTRGDNVTIELNGTEVKHCDKLTYVGLRIGKYLQKTKLQMLKNVESKISTNST